MLFAALAVTLAAAAPAPRVTFAFVPPGGADEDTKALGLVLQSRTAEVLRATGHFSELHAKQMMSMAGSEAFKPDQFGADPKVDADVASYLGADVFLSGVLEKVDTGYVFKGASGTRGGPPAAIKPVKMGATPVAALNQAIDDIAKQVATSQKKKVVKWPDLKVGTSNDEALLAYARCHQAVLRQSMGIEAPVTLNAEMVGKAIADCKRAVELDGKFVLAKLVLAIAHAIEGNDAEATRLLAETGEQDSALYWIARFWLVTRYQSPEAGEAVLRAAIEKRPGFLLAQIYLCEELTALGAYDKALKACDEVRAATPRAVFPLLRVGKVLARLGKVDDGIRQSQEALKLEPAGLKSREASLQLASRWIDAGKPSEAIDILEQIVNDPQARGEELLRLGYAYQLKGQPDTAKGLYEKAVAKAPSPGEWRTRGRAHYDLALLHAKAGAKDRAKAALLESMKTGYRAKALDPALKDAARDLERVDLAAGGGGPAKSKLTPGPAPREVNLFQVDASGELEVGPSPKAPPPDFIKLKF